MRRSPGQGQRPQLSPERFLASLSFSDSAIPRSLQGLKELDGVLLGAPRKAVSLSVPIWRVGTHHSQGTLWQQALGAGVTRGGCWGHHGPDPPRPHPDPYQQRRPEEEDGDLDVGYHLQHRQMLQRLLAMLGSAIGLRPQTESQSQGPKER